MSNDGLQEFLRWQNERRQGEGADRWTRWARLMSARFDPARLHHRGVAMTLLAQQRSLLQHIQYWQTAAYHFLPQINLSIAPLLLQMLEKSGKAVFVNQKKFEKELVGLPRASMPSEIPKRTSPVFLQTTARGENQSEINGRRFASFTAEMMTPLRLALRRLEENENEAKGQSTTVEAAKQIVRRVVNQRQRLEDKAGRPAMVQQVKRLVREQSLRAREQASEERPNASTALPVAHASFPNANIEKLTEQIVRQIDQHMVAYRERFGKAF